MQAIKVGDNEYEIAGEELRIAVGYIHQVAKSLGIPVHSDIRIEGETPWKLIDAMMQMWASMYPWEVKAFRESIADDQSIERTPHEANKAEGGHIPISYPTRLYNLLKLYFPHERYAERKLIRKFVQRYPILQVTKFKI